MLMNKSTKIQKKIIYHRHIGNVYNVSPDIRLAVAKAQCHKISSIMFGIRSKAKYINEQ